MKYTAVVLEKDGWWIGWLVELPGVNAQERTREEPMESLRVGAEDVLETEIDLPQGAHMETIEV